MADAELELAAELRANIAVLEKGIALNKAEGAPVATTAEAERARDNYRRALLREGLPLSL